MNNIALAYSIDVATTINWKTAVKLIYSILIRLLSGSPTEINSSILRVRSWYIVTKYMLIKEVVKRKIFVLQLSKRKVPSCMAKYFYLEK